MSSSALELARSVLAGQRAWVVGGALRDRALGRDTEDLDVVLEGDVAGAARALGRAGGAAAFELSEDFGAWRVAARDGAWHIDVNPVRGGSLEDDLALRDFTVNAVAEPLAGGPPVDPLGGLGDLAAGRLRLAAPDALAADPLRVLRLARLAVELDLEPDDAALASARRHAPALRRVAAERSFAELKRIVVGGHAVRALRLMERIGATEALLPEVAELRGVEQNRFHHLDVYDHTLEVLASVIDLERDPGWALGEVRADAVRRLLAEPLADELTRAGALRFGALLHDVAKPPTRAVLPDGRVSFLGHDEVGARMARDILARLRASERLRGHVASLTHHHLRLGFMVHERPVNRRAVYRYLRACEPVEADVTLLSVADRLATRGDRAEESIGRHLELARDVMAAALDWHEHGPPAPLVRGDELVRELGLAPGPQLGRLLEELSEAQYAGEVSSRAQALQWARTHADGAR